MNGNRAWIWVGLGSVALAGALAAAQIADLRMAPVQTAAQRSSAQEEPKRETPKNEEPVAPAREEEPAKAEEAEWQSQYIRVTTTPEDITEMIREMHEREGRLSYGLDVRKPAPKQKSAVQSILDWIFGADGN